MYDPKTKQTHPIDTCYSWGHANFDKNDVLWSSFGPGVEGWFDTRIWDKTHDEQKAQGWTVFVLDTNGNGKRDAYVEADQPLDPAKDKRMNGRSMACPRRRTARSGEPSKRAWRNHASRSRIEPARNGALRVLRSAVQQLEGARPALRRAGWTSTARAWSGRFSRAVNSPVSTAPSARVAERTDGNGQHCPEGWASTRCRVRTERRVDSASADSLYYDFVDQFNMLGVGKDVPIATGNESEGLLALVDGKFLTFRVPYPMGFFAKGMDGRIDDPNAGWKGKAIYTSYSTRAPFHMEGGRGTTSKLVKFQVRPTPLAK
jgi:hypothetical protein